MRAAFSTRTPILYAVRVTLERRERTKHSATIVSRSGAPAERLPRVLPPGTVQKIGKKETSVLQSDRRQVYLCQLPSHEEVENGLPDVQAAEEGSVFRSSG